MKQLTRLIMLVVQQTFLMKCKTCHVEKGSDFVFDISSSTHVLGWNNDFFKNNEK